MPSPRRGCWRALNWRTCRRTIWWPTPLPRLVLWRVRRHTACAVIVPHHMPAGHRTGLTVGAGLRRLSFTTCPAAPSSRWRLTSNGRARWRRGNGRPACGSGNGRRPRWWSDGSSRYPTRFMWTRRNDWGSRWSAGARVAARWWSSREGRSPIRCTRRDGSWTAWTRRRPTGCATAG